MLAIGEWHRVLAGHYGRRIFLRVDGILHSAGMLPGEMLPSSGNPLYLGKWFCTSTAHTVHHCANLKHCYITLVLHAVGGVPDLSELPLGSVSGLPVPFRGCIRQLSLNWRRTALDHDHILAARNIADCDGTRCGGDTCEHGGSCWLDKHHVPHCTCLQVQCNIF